MYMKKGQVGTLKQEVYFDLDPHMNHVCHITSRQGEINEMHYTL